MEFYDLAGDTAKLSLVPKDIESVTFALYKGERGALLAVVAEVDGEWTQYFSEDDEIFCGFMNGELASFCIIDANGGTGDIGCVGTRPAFRRRGIGLETVKRAALLLKERGCGKITVRKTHLAEWYGRLGFQIGGEKENKQ